MNQMERRIQSLEIEKVATDAIIKQLSERLDMLEDKLEKMQKPQPVVGLPGPPSLGPFPPVPVVAVVQKPAPPKQETMMEELKRSLKKMKQD